MFDTKAGDVSPALVTSSQGLDAHLSCWRIFSQDMKDLAHSRRLGISYGLSGLPGPYWRSLTGTRQSSQNRQNSYFGLFKNLIEVCHATLSLDPQPCKVSPIVAANCTASIPYSAETLPSLSDAQALRQGWQGSSLGKKSASPVLAEAS